MLSEEIEQLSVDVILRQGLHFSEHKDALRYLEQVKSTVHQSLKHGSIALKEGLAVLSDIGNGYVSEFSARLLKRLDSSKKIAKFMGAELLNLEASAPQFMAVLESFEQGDEQRKFLVIAVLAALFPSHPQPYIYMGTAIWSHDGIDAAEKFYCSIVDTLEHPALDYFAADCLYKNNNVGDSKELLLRALQKINESPELYTYLKPQLIALFEEILTIKKY